MKFSITFTDCALNELETILAAIKAPSPKTQAALAVCSTADAAQPTTAPDFSPAPTTAFAPIAPPPAPPVAPAAPQSEPPAPVATSAVELDSEGLPWDGRIHASTKAKVAGGVWRTRRGLDAATHDRIKAELKAAMGLPAPAVAAPPVTAAPPAPVTAAPPAPVTVAPVAPPAPPAPPAGPMTFATLIQRITAMSVADPSGTQAKVLAAVQQAGLPSLPLLAARPDLIPTVAATLGIMA